MRNKELNMKLGQLQDEISKAFCQLVLIYVTSLNQLFWKLIKEKFTLHEVNFGGAVKSSLLSIMLHILPHEP